MSWFPPGLSTGARRPRRSLAMVTALAASAALAACGDAGASGAAGGSDAASGSGDCSAPGITDDSIKLAIISPQSGPSASSFAGFAAAAKARIDEFNEGGGLDGRTIEVVLKDDLGDATAQSDAARAALQNDHVFGIIAASRVDTMYDILAAESVPVTGLMTPTAYSEDDNAFGFAGGSNIGWANTNLMERLQKAGATNLAIVANNSPAAVAGTQAAVAMAKEVGLEVSVSATDIPLGAFDATAQAIQMKQEGVDGLDALTLADSSLSILKALDAQGVTLKAPYLFGVYAPEVARQVSGDIQGVLSSATGLRPTQVDTPEMQAYLDAMAKYAPKTEASGNFTSGGYVAADLMITGLEKAGNCLSRESFVENLRKVDDYDGAGLLVPDTISFTGGPNPNGSTPYSECEWYVVRQGDEWVPDAKPVCSEMIKLAH